LLDREVELENICRDVDHQWYGALTLAERTQGLGEESADIPQARVSVRIKRWERLAGMAYHRLVAARNRDHNLTESQFSYLVAEDSARLKARLGGASPPWLERLAGSAYGAATPADRTLGPDADLGLVSALGTLVNDRERTLLARSQSVAAANGIAPEMLVGAVRPLATNLVGRLRRILERTLVLELNIASLEGKLSGDTPEARYQQFVDMLRDPFYAYALLRGYPVLARQVALESELWLEGACELLERLGRDWNLLAAFQPSGQEIGRVVGVKPSLGDRHRGGRTVSEIGFASGLRLIYKPRSLGTEARYQTIVTWANGLGLSRPMRTLRIVDRGEYGWAEFVSQEPCQDLAEAKRFFFRQGASLALVYALRGSDFHYQNVIAAGEHPVLVDLETLLLPKRQPRLQTEEANTRMNDSVMGTQLVPRRQWGSEHATGLDFSGLGGPGERPSVAPTWTREGEGRDDFRYVKRRVTMDDGKNIVRLDGQKLAPSAFADDVDAGFTEMYTLIEQNQSDLLRPGGFLESFAEDPVRIILVSTSVYSVMLKQAYHPDLLRDDLELEAFLDQLRAGDQEGSFLPYIQKGAREAIRRGDIPTFITRPSSRSLWVDGRHLVPDFFDTSGLEATRDRIERFGPRDLAQQRWFISASLAVLDTEVGRPRASFQPPEPGVPLAPADPQRCRALAVAIGDRLETLAQEGDSSTFWFGVRYARAEEWNVGPVGVDLHEGLPGVALFLAFLAYETGEPRYAHLARRTLAELRAKLTEIERSGQRMALGAMTGWGGVIYTYALLAQIWSRDDLLDLALAEALRLAERIDEDVEYDIASGAAGLALALSVLQRLWPRGEIEALLRRCGVRLAATAQPAATGGVAWGSPRQPTPLTGFGHGTAGNALALFRIAELIGEQRYADVARQAIQYERGLFSEAKQNWPDFRLTGQNSDGQPTYPVFWCHGAPGIGSARLAHLGQTDDQATRAEIASAVATTRRQGFAGNHCLCHGAMGNLDFLLSAASTLRDPVLMRTVQETAAAVLARFDRDGWITGLPKGLETPGLMMGISGIGYELLRLANPTAVPSLLTFECQAPADLSHGGTASERL
jgi:type 2 lantibiotic biosynthesis protein LanM